MLLYRLEDKRVQSFFLVGKYPSRAECERVLTALSQALKESGKAAPLKRVAELSDVAETRVKVVISLLERMGLVERRSNRLTTLRTFKNARELAAFITAYERRHQRDVERLQAMMHYAQHPACRTGMIAEYFGEELREQCGACDVCVGEREREPQVRQRERKPRPPRPTDKPRGLEFSQGDAVEHARFGRGRVESIERTQVRVQFARGGRKLIAANELALVA